MRVQGAWLVSVGVTGALVACAGAAEPRPEPTSAQSPSAEEPSEPVGSPSIATAEPTPEVPIVDEPTPGPSGEPTPTFYTSVSFDLRSMPHRAPYDVDSRLVSGRVELLMQRVRDAAGEPAPRLLVYRMRCTRAALPRRAARCCPGARRLREFVVATTLSEAWPAES